MTNKELVDEIVARIRKVIEEVLREKTTGDDEYRRMAAEWFKQRTK